MLTDEKGARLTPFEEALLNNYDGKIAQVLVNGDRNGYCDLTEAFVVALYRKVWREKDSYTIISRIVNCSDFLTAKIVDEIFATKDKEQIALYLHSSRGCGMESRHIIQLIELGFEDEIDFFFYRHATMVLEYEDDEDESEGGWYYPVVKYLRERGLYKSYRAKYMPRKKFS